MIKKWLITKGLKLLVVAIVLGIGIWYLSSAIGGASLSYTSVDLFMKQIGASDGEVSSVNGCFLCVYIGELFAVLGDATEMFWTSIVNTLWLLMAVGFGIFIIFHTIQFIRENATSKDIKDLTDNEPKLEFKKWFEKVWKNGLRIIVAGALIGALNWTSTSSLRTVTYMTVTPVMYIGSNLSMLATGVISNASCTIPEMTNENKDIFTPVLHPFMCVIGNLNTVMLAGAGGGFALMNYAWLDLDGDSGGVFTWLAGLALVLMFLIIGFDLFFKILSVFFKLVFVIIFMPLLIAAAAFEPIWGLAKNLLNSAIKMLIDSTVSILKISLKIVIIYAIVYFSADRYYPGPEDNFTSILPPLIAEIKPENMDAQTMSVMKAFSDCEHKSVINNAMDKATFVECFTKRRESIQQKYPDAFKFMDDGFNFFIFMLGVFMLYFWIISPQVDKLLGGEEKESFDYGGWLKSFGKATVFAPVNIYMKIREKIKEGK